MKPFVLAISILATACYGNPPPAIPRPDVPQVVPGASLDVDARTEDEMRPVTHRNQVCSGGDCSTIAVTSDEHVTVKHARVTYGGHPLTLGQAEAIGDPAYLSDYDKMTRLAASCRHASIPKFAGDILGTAGMLLVIDGAGTTGATNIPVVVGGAVALAAGLASYALGRFAFGGQDCDPAMEIYEARRDEWRAAGDTDVEDDLADELDKIARDFNARQPH